MPHLTRNEFAEMCGDDVKKLNVYIQRGKIVPVPGNKKLIDPANPQNNAFMVDRQLANQLKGQGLPAPKAAKVKPIKVSKKEHKQQEIVQEIPKNGTKIPKIVDKVAKNATEPREVKQAIARQTAESQKRIDQEYKKKELEIANLELAQQLKELALQKSAGELLPIDLVRGLIERNANSIFKQFGQGVEKLATMYCNSMAAGDRAMLGEILDNGKRIIGECISDSGKHSEQEIQILVAEFSKKLVRGQKKI